MDEIGSVVISANPVTAWENFEDTLSAGEFRKLRSSHRDIGGCWKLNFEKEVKDRAKAIEYLINGPGRQVQTYNHRDGRLDWGGIIGAVTLDTGYIKVAMSLNDITNKVWGRRQPVGGGAVARTAAQEDAISQARFGIIEDVRTCGEMSVGSAEQYCRKHLYLHYWPYLTNFGWSGGRGAYLKFNCLGWWHTLKWRRYEQTILGGEANANVVVSAIITATGQFIASTRIDANATQIAQKHDADRTSAAILKSIANVGDAQDNPWVVGVDAHREFYYEEAAMAKLI